MDYRLAVDLVVEFFDIDPDVAHKEICDKYGDTKLADLVKKAIIEEHKPKKETPEGVRYTEEYPMGIYDDDDENHYRPSSTNRDYSPSSPWNAPGMSISDFI